MRTAPALIIPDEHVEIGNALKHCRPMLMLLMRRTPPSSPIHRDAARAIDVLDRLRTRLDCHLHLTVAATRDPRLLLSSVYSGTRWLAWREYDPDEMDRDDFAAWALDR
ncbi:hypothetical protein EDC22_1134 [Tepidamorphus gemmatus]|uniref:Uncharacterized protein n=1 Tax=Tepidamorphus gemmatus TaxID=747076 RepID=A0A4R3LXS9_9HYPH|nr:hypothetical protein [Tepidamorphus gemmatus]TCT05383.1 hypothetical protein EDC22_1134 [Tepidamorphus gemmatus]